jgi:hypothetical protein
MKTIVVVCVPTRDGGLSAKKAIAVPNNGTLPGCDDLGIQGASRSLESPKREQSTPPFWTWFIENPRGHGAA